ncbi:MAG: diacylglycerol O-acyltransferase / wax synthase [Acidimicrobiaceae bacterium]|jgi:WS/DGAT/MGAT family acyltransferase|nr:diacylglycerol O-acyltransferase / wax synthase [Acidimicrobiaceae bacterium]MDQ1412716.1 diacylglycerol O-acyltransferase / wax synthase [Acidimicrobiaceae bacterium]MDQ1416316.1 diacylglycerol O-acyltransferase / wax synthase [Acidimicrobiaceae bacterium]
MADEPGSEQRMGDADALMWSIEKDPMLRSTITSVLVFDRPIDHDRLVDKVERASRAIPRLRQRVMANTFSIAPPRWEVDPNFDLRYHLRFVASPSVSPGAGPGASPGAGPGASPGAGTMSDVLAIASPEAMSSFDLARPLWQMLVVEGMADGRSAVVVKLHHTITDGIGGVKLGMQLFDLEESPALDPGPIPEAPPVHVMNQWERVLDAWNHEQRQGLALATRLVPLTVGGLTHLLWAPAETLKRAGEVAGSMGRLLAPANRPLSPIMTGRSLSVDLDVLSIPLADAKAAAKAGGGRLNDFFMAAVMGGLRRYHDEHGDTPESLRMGMPISLRHAGGVGTADPGGGGNQFVPTRFLVPLKVDDPAERMRILHELVAGQRAEPALGLVDAVSLVTRRLPKVAQIGVLGGLLRTVDVITSNVPGVPIPLFLAGAKLEAQYPFGPRSGAAVNVTLLSYLDGLFIGVNSDPAAVPDQARFMACLRDGFDEVLKVA